MILQSKKLLVRITAFVLAAAMILGAIGWEPVSASAAVSPPYLIKVNRVQCTITIYEKDAKGKYTVPIKAMVCSPGWDTKLGTFRTPSKYRWRLLMDDVWGQYSTRINGGILFHSVWYYQKDPSTLSYKQFNKLGTICSHGCIRVNVEDAKWIYDNCPLGTTVIIYDDKNSPGPLGKPETIKLTPSSGIGYDPTDIWSPSNPYNKKNPVISGAENQTIQCGAAVNVKKGVTAKSTVGANVTSDIKVSITYDGKKVNEVDSKKSGVYKVTYQITDIMKRTAKKTVSFTVLGSNASPKLSGIKDMVVKGGTKVNKSFALKNVKATWDKQELNKNGIKVKIENVANEGYEIYEVTYTVTAPNGKTAEKTATISVDSTAPEIKGVEDKEIAWDTPVDKESVMEGISVTDDYTAMKASDIKVSIKENTADNSYTITYQTVDRVGNRTTKTAVYTVTDFLRIDGARNQTVNADETVDGYFALQQGVKAYDGSEDATDKLKAEVKETEADKKYEVTYSIEDGKGHMEKITVVFTKADPE